MMELRFFIDQCVPNSVVKPLFEAGYKVFILKDHIPPTSEDPVVIGKSQELDAILISLNGDFSDIVTYPPENFKGIIAIQIRNHPEIIQKLMERLMNYLSVHQNMTQYKGLLLLVEVHRIRIRR